MFFGSKIENETVFITMRERERGGGEGEEMSKN